MGAAGFDGDDITGALAHVLGHTFRLQHPPDGVADRARALMAEHWHYPQNIFLPDERSELLLNPFFEISGP